MGIRVTVSVAASVLCLCKKLLAVDVKLMLQFSLGRWGLQRSQWAHDVAARLASPSEAFFYFRRIFIWAEVFFHFGWTKLIGKNYFGLRAFWAQMGNFFPSMGQISHFTVAKF
jgi:hypothetical protein